MARPATTLGVLLRPGIARRVRELHRIPTEIEQAAMLGVDRTTLRRVDQGPQPSGYFMAQFCTVFGLGLGEVFEIVAVESRSRLIVGT